MAVGSRRALGDCLSGVSSRQGRSSRAELAHGPRQTPLQPNPTLGGPGGG